MKKLPVILATGLLCSLSVTGVHAKSRVIHQQEFGAEWPFTVPQGELRCSRSAVTFKTGGITYAVNGIAMGKGFADIEPIWKLNMKMIEQIAKALDIPTKQAAKESPIRVNIGPIIDAGLELC